MHSISKTRLALTYRILADPVAYTGDIASLVSDIGYIGMSF